MKKMQIILLAGIVAAIGIWLLSGDSGGRPTLFAGWYGRSEPEHPKSAVVKSGVVSGCGRTAGGVCGAGGGGGITNALSAGSLVFEDSADLYAGAELLAQRILPPDAAGAIRRKRLVRTGSKYPLTLVDEYWQPVPGHSGLRLVRQLAMVGDHVMVRLRQGHSEAELLAAVKAQGFELRRRMRVPGGYLVAVKSATVESVQQLKGGLVAADCVDVAEPDFVEHMAETTPNDPSYGKLWGMMKIGAPKVWDMFTGSPESVVAVFDTGTDLAHEDLVDNLWHNPGEIPDNGVDDDDNGYVDDVYGWDFYAEDNDPSDVYGHGSHVAGTVGARGDNGLGVVGVNWQVKIMTIKFFGRNAQGGLEGYASDAADGMYYVITQAINGVPVHVTNHSWGGPGYSYILEDAMEAAGMHGVMHVVAAGNDGSLNNDTDPQYPASYTLSNIVAVANTTSGDGLASSSHYGLTSVDLGAPGSSIYSISWGGGYKYMTGTSMASPHVAGAAALMFAYLPQLSWQQVRRALLEGVDPLPALAGKCVTGGRLNLYSALAEVGPYIEHTPLDNTTDVGHDHIVEACIHPGVPLLDTNSVLVLWNNTGSTSTFSTSIMYNVTNDLFRGSIPAQSEGTAIYYMIKARSLTGGEVLDPTNAPTQLHHFDVTKPEDMLVYGDPGDYGVVAPPYGQQSEPWGSTVTATAQLYCAEAAASRYRCDGWYGGGNVPAVGSSNRISFVIDRTSAIMWRWQKQYSLTQSASPVIGAVDAVTWWDAGASGVSLSAPDSAELNGSNYSFVCWYVDGDRFPDATNAALNPATGLVMSSGRTARASYMPTALDIDGDGLPDWWENRYFASLDSAAADDVDGDGFDNAAEYADRSDPRDLLSVPTGPSIEQVPLRDPMGIPSPWPVSAVVTDRVGVSGVQLFWQRNAGSWSSAVMVTNAAGVYTAEIPSPHALDDLFSYYIRAVDSASNVTMTLTNTFRVAYAVVALEPGSLYLLAESGESVSGSVMLVNRGNVALDWQIQTNWQDSIAAGTNGWTHSGIGDEWHISQQEAHSAPAAWYCGSEEFESYNNAVDASLVMPEVALGAEPVLSFWQWFRSEYDGRSGYENYYWDGGVVDVSTNGGLSFDRVVPAGGYPFKITPNDDSPFPAHTPCLAGTGGWERVEFDLADYAGKRVQVRFRFGSDHYTVERGWFIDDVELAWKTSWLCSEMQQGQVPGHTASVLVLDVNAAGLALGEHHNSLSLVCNDPTNALVTVAVTVRVVESKHTQIKFDPARPDGFVIAWEAAADKQYSLMTTTNLCGGLWQGVPGYTNLPGINGLMSYTGSLQNAATCFYRVTEEPH